MRGQLSFQSGRSQKKICREASCFCASYVTCLIPQVSSSFAAKVHAAPGGVVKSSRICPLWFSLTDAIVPCLYAHFSIRVDIDIVLEARAQKGWLAPFLRHHQNRLIRK